MKKLSLLALLAVIAGCGTVTTNFADGSVRPTVAPVQVTSVEAPQAQQTVREFKKAVVAKKYLNCTSSMSPKLVVVVDNLKSELPPKPEAANLPSMIGNSFLSVSRELRSACGSGDCPTGATGRPQAVTPPLHLNK